MAMKPCFARILGTRKSLRCEEMLKGVALLNRGASNPN
jgi:hypothetical protein